MTPALLWVFLVLLVLAVPVAHAMVGGVAAALWLADRPLAVIAQRLYTPTQSFPMLAIPFFILAGSLMMSGRFGVYLVNVARLIVGRFKGGLGHVSIIGSVMFDPRWASAGGVAAGPLEWERQRHVAEHGRP